MKAEQLRSFRTQNLLLEFAGFRYVRPEGVYISLTSGNPRLWTGVMFMRRGPYKFAVLRFRIRFPSQYPTDAPLIIFTSDVFHPLVMASSGRMETVDSDDEEIDQPPGVFNLRQGFPQWATSTKNDDSSAIFGSMRSRKTIGSKLASVQDEEDSSSTPFSTMPIVDVVRYMRSCFEDENVIDSITLEQSLNSSAWYAWRAHRASAAGEVAPSLEGRSGVKDPSDWNWKGVFTSRAERTVQESLSNASLYGDVNTRDETIVFSQPENEDFPHETLE